MGTVPLTPMLGAALECARHDLPVYPARPRSKSPLWKGWQRGATTKVDHLVNVWTRHPDANVGIACRGIVVLDADSRRGVDSVEELNLPPTTTVQTRRGNHWYFLGGIPGARTTALPDVEIRGKNQGVLAAGSVHPSGHLYEWEIPPWEVPPIPLPDEVRELAKKRGAPGLLSEGHQVFPGGRSVYLLRVAGSLRARHGVGDVTRLLGEFNKVQCCPPLPVEKVKKLAREAAKLAVLPWLVDPIGFATGDERLSQDARLVLMLLARHADHTGQCFPGVRRLASQAGCRLERITKATRELEGAGRIDVKRSQRGNRYTILPWEGITSDNRLTSVPPVGTPGRRT